MKTENRALDLSIIMLNGYDNKKPYSVDTDFDDKGNDDFSSLTDTTLQAMIILFAYRNKGL